MRNHPTLPLQQFGRTGHASTRVIFGAAALGSMSQESADAVLPTLLEFGVNHLDTAAGYGDSELRLAPWLRAHPDRFFVATKTGERDGDGARAGLEQSLERLGVDSVDLIQLHNLVEPDEWAAALGPGGAAEALERARDEGLVRFIGVTGHGLRIAARHRESLERFDFDSVLLPYNPTLLANRDYRSDVEELLGECDRRGVAVQTIKSLARRRWRDEDPGPRHAWYQPLDDRAAIDDAVRWVLANQQLFLNTSSDARLLRPTLEAATTQAPPPSTDEILDRQRSLGVEPIFDDQYERI